MKSVMEHNIEGELYAFYYSVKNYGIDKDRISSVQSFGRVRLFVTPWIAARQVSLSITNSQSSL